jgi:hypothetical protein
MPSFDGDEGGAYETHDAAAPATRHAHASSMSYSHNPFQRSLLLPPPSHAHHHHHQYMKEERDMKEGREMKETEGRWWWWWWLSWWKWR